MKMFFKLCEKELKNMKKIQKECCTCSTSLFKNTKFTMDTGNAKF